MAFSAAGLQRQLHVGCILPAAPDVEGERYDVDPGFDCAWVSSAKTGEKLGAGGEITIQRGIPGIGEFQCYDEYMLKALKAAAKEVSEPEWCAHHSGTFEACWHVYIYG